MAQNTRKRKLAALLASFSDHDLDEAADLLSEPPRSCSMPGPSSTGTADCIECTL